MKHILDFTDNKVYLSIDSNRLVIKLNNDVEKISLSDIESIILGNPRITISQQTLSKFGSCNIPCFVLDTTYTVSSIITPTQYHTTQKTKLFKQIELYKPIKTKIWDALLSRKIANQIDVIKHYNLNDKPAERISKSKHTLNTKEAQVAKYYWNTVFNMHRNRGEDDENRILNYGYIILRAKIIRFLFAHGLNPCFGFNHSNKYNPFVLADDIIEPFRCVVDRFVLESSQTKLTKETKTPTHRVSWFNPLPLRDDKFTGFYYYQSNQRYFKNNRQQYIP